MTNKANISATNLYLFCAVLFMSCHLWLSLVLFLFCFFITFSFSFLLTFFTDHVFVGSLVSGMISVCKSARMHFLLNQYLTLVWIHDQTNLSLVIFSGCVMIVSCLLLYFGVAWPHCTFDFVAPPPNLCTMYYLHSSGHCHIVGCSSTLTALLAPVLLSRLLSPLTGFTSS